VRADEWATKISKAYIDFSVQMWKIRCQIVHANSVGTSDHTYRLMSMEILKKLKKNPWKLQFQDRHLIQRSEKFIEKAPIATVKMWRKILQVSTSGKEERENAMGKDLNFFVEKRERRKSRIYSIPYKRKRRNQPSEQSNLGIVKQVLPIKNKMIARTYSRGKNKTKTQSIKASVLSLAKAHDKRAQKDGSHTTGATNIPRPFFHTHHQQSDEAKKKTTTKIHSPISISPTKKNRSIKSNVYNS